MADSAAMNCSGVASQAPATNATHSDLHCIETPARVVSRDHAPGVDGTSAGACVPTSGIAALARCRLGNRIAIIAANRRASTPIVTWTRPTVEVAVVDSSSLMKSSARSCRSNSTLSPTPNPVAKAAEPEREQLEHGPWTRDDQDGDADSERVRHRRQGHHQHRTPHDGDATPRWRVALRGADQATVSLLRTHRMRQ